MQIESDGLRRRMLRAVGAKHAFIRDIRVDPALFTTQPLQDRFDDVQVSTESRFLYCLTSDVRKNQFSHRDPVAVPGIDKEFYIAEPPSDEEGISQLVLLKE